MTSRDKLLAALFAAFFVGLGCVSLGSGMLNARLGMMCGGAVLAAFAAYLIGLVWNSRP